MCSGVISVASFCIVTIGFTAAPARNHVPPTRRSSDAALAAAITRSSSTCACWARRSDFTTNAV